MARIETDTCLFHWLGTSFVVNLDLKSWTFAVNLLLWSWFCVLLEAGHFVNSVWTGTCSNNHGTVSQNSGLLIPAADAWLSITAKAASKAAKHFSKKAAKKGKKVGGSEHTKNKRQASERTGPKTRIRLDQRERNKRGHQTGARRGESVRKVFEHCRFVDECHVVIR